MRKIENADVEEITNDTKCGQIGIDATNFFETIGKCQTQGNKTRF